VPAAWPSGGSVHLPAGAAIGGGADEVFEGFGVARAHDHLERIQRVAQALRLLENFLAVAQQDVAPDVRITRRDAGEVTETGASQRQELAPRRLRQHRVEVGECQQVRQVADGGERGVVVLRRHAQHLAADGGPHVGGLLHHHRVGLRQRCQDDLLALVELHVGVLDPGDFLARDRVRGDKAADALLEHAPRHVHHVALGAAHVHEQRARLDHVADGLERRLARRHRHRDQHDVRARHRQQRRLGRDVDHAHAARTLHRRRRLAVAHHALHQPGPFQRQREAAAHQAAADHPQLIEHGVRAVLSERRSGRCRAP
jgi:hypothetical protein